MWRGPYTRAGDLEVQPRPLTCDARKSQPAPECPRMEKEAAGTWCIMRREWVVGLEVTSAGAAAYCGSEMVARVLKVNFCLHSQRKKIHPETISLKKKGKHVGKYNPLTK